MNFKIILSSIDEMKNKTDNKKEKNILNTFYVILSSLEKLELWEDKNKLVLDKIESFDIWSTQEKKIKFLNKKLTEFIAFLKSDLELIQEWYYIGLGMSLGMVFGLAFTSISWLDLGMWNPTTGGLIWGMVVWMFIGVLMDIDAKKKNKTFKIN